MTTQALFQQFYYSNPAFRGGTWRFHRICREHIHPRSRVLEVGPGPENPTTAFLSSFAEPVGVDISHEIQANSSLKAACLYDGSHLPFEAESFDACVSNYVLEHVEQPGLHLREVARVLKPGGVYCFRTPNLWHYVTLASRLLPHRAHLRWANWLRLLTDAHEPYPTRYRLNTRASIIAQGRRAGLTLVALDFIEAEPLYGRRHPLLFYPMLAYERLVNATEQFAPFRMNIVAVLARKS